MNYTTIDEMKSAADKKRGLRVEGSVSQRFKGEVTYLKCVSGNCGPFGTLYEFSITGPKGASQMVNENFASALLKDDVERRARA